MDQIIDAEAREQFSGTSDFQSPVRDADDNGRWSPVATMDVGIDDDFLEGFGGNLWQAAAQNRAVPNAEVADGFDHVLPDRNAFVLRDDHGLEKRNVPLDGRCLAEQEQARQ